MAKALVANRSIPIGTKTVSSESALAEARTIAGIAAIIKIQTNGPPQSADRIIVTSSSACSLIMEAALPGESIGSKSPVLGPPSGGL